MNLFIDTLSKDNVLILFDDNRSIITKYDFDVKMNESTRLIGEIDVFLKNNNTNYKDLENIVVVNGPGSFTGIRTLVILVNTINYVIKKNITPISFFDLYDTFPILKTSSRRDSFIKFGENEQIQTIYNDEIEKLLNDKGIKKLNACSEFGDFEVNLKPDYENIIKNVDFKDFKQIQAFYLKKPNIF